MYPRVPGNLDHQPNHSSNALCALSASFAKSATSPPPTTTLTAKGGDNISAHHSSAPPLVATVQSSSVMLTLSMKCKTVILTDFNCLDPINIKSRKLLFSEYKVYNDVLQTVCADCLRHTPGLGMGNRTDHSEVSSQPEKPDVSLPPMHFALHLQFHSPLFHHDEG